MADEATAAVTTMQRTLAAMLHAPTASVRLFGSTCDSVLVQRRYRQLAFFVFVFFLSCSIFQTQGVVKIFARFALQIFTRLSLHFLISPAAQMRAFQTSRGCVFILDAVASLSPLLLNFIPFTFSCSCLFPSAYLIRPYPVHW